MKCIYNDAGRCNLFSNDWSNGTYTNNEDCPYRKPITNADKIRAMTDAELATFLSEATSNATVVLGIGSGKRSKSAFDWYDWLKQEAQA